MIDRCCICGSKAEHKCDVFYGEFMQIEDCGLLHIGICTSCGYIYVMNPLSLDITNNYYQTPRWQVAKNNLRVAAHIERSRKQMQFILNTIGSIETVLEIGALEGGNLNLYKELGVSVCGTDLSLQNVEYAKNQYNIELFHMDLDEFYVVNKDRFDLVILSNLLEHIIDPCTVMKKIASISTNYVYIEVPSFDYKYIDMPYGMFIPTHQSYFTLESLKNLMRRAGYKLLDSNLMLAGGTRPSTFNTPLMQTVWQKLQPNESGWESSCLLPTISSEQHLDFYLTCSQKSIIEISSIIDCIPNNLRLAIWCLSRHTALLFHMTNLSKKNIIKFYDNADIFYNRKIRGLEVGLFDKEDAETNQIEAILISSYEHQPSIVKQIKSSGFGCEIITLYK